jgi:hypothetical protein
MTFSSLGALIGPLLSGSAPLLVVLAVAVMWWLDEELDPAPGE